MAYLTHSAYQAKSKSAHAFRATRPTRLAGVAAVLALVAGSYAAMSYGGGSAPMADVAAKGDRMAMATESVRAGSVAAPISSQGMQTMTDDRGRVVFHQDAAQRTTTVVRGATIPLTNASPYPGAR